MNDVFVETPEYQRNKDKSHILTLQSLFGKDARKLYQACSMMESYNRPPYQKPTEVQKLKKAQLNIIHAIGEKHHLSIRFDQTNMEESWVISNPTSLKEIGSFRV